VGHGLQDGIVELNGPWDQQGRVRGLRGHAGDGAEGSGLGRGERRGDGAVDGFILDVVGREGVPLGREGRVELGERRALAEVPGNDTQARSRP